MLTQVLSKNAKALVKPLAKILAPQKFILAGGTALALHLGHRESVDFDFFCVEDFDPAFYVSQFSQIAKVKISLQDHDSLVCMVDGVKLSLFRYWDKFLYATTDWQSLRLADPKDIALMKLIAVSQRGARKDFIDLYFLFSKKVISPRDALVALKKKSPKIEQNTYHVLKSLAYFADAENEPMPKMLKKVSWKEIRLFFEKMASTIVSKQ